MPPGRLSPTERTNVSNGFLIVDGNSIGFAAHSATKLTVAGQEVQAIFGFVKTLRKMMVLYPTLTPLVLWDGRSWRKEVFTEYKSNRDADPKQKLDRERYKSQRPAIAKALWLLGVCQIAADNMEADDIAGMLANKLSGDKRAVLATGDRDWWQLINERIEWVDFVHERRITHENFQQETGYLTTRRYLQGKALMGDTSDCIPGVGKIGEKGAAEILAQYEAVIDFVKDKKDILAKLPADTKEAKLHKAVGGKSIYNFVTNANGGLTAFVRNMNLMDLTRPKNRPAPINLKHRKRAPDLQGFEAFCADHQFLSILKDMDEFVKPYVRTIQ
jgi:DNA polymerase-1